MSFDNMQGAPAAKDTLGLLENETDLVLVGAVKGHGAAFGLADHFAGNGEDVSVLERQLRSGQRTDDGIG